MYLNSKKKTKYQLAPAIRSGNRNYTNEIHRPSNNWEKKNASFAYKFETPPNGQKSVYIQEALMIGNIHSWSISKR